VDLQDLVHASVPLSVDFGAAGTLTLHFCPGELTPHVRTQIASDDPAQIASAVADVVTDWDLTDGGEPIVPNAEAMTMRVPIIVVETVAAQITAAVAGMVLPAHDEGEEIPAATEGTTP